MDEQAFWTSEVATMLGVQDVTVRSWALRLEKYGYSFARDNNDKRAFFERDISVLRVLQSQVQDKKLKLDDAARVTADRFKLGQEHHEQGKNGIMGIAIADQENAIESRYDALFKAYSALLSRFEQQEKTHQEIIARLDQQAEHEKIQQEILKRLDLQSQQQKEDTQTIAAIQEQNEHMKRLEDAIERRDQALMSALTNINMLRKMEFDRQSRTFWQRLRGR